MNSWRPPNLKFFSLAIRQVPCELAVYRRLPSCLFVGFWSAPTCAISWTQGVTARREEGLAALAEQVCEPFAAGDGTDFAWDHALSNHFCPLPRGLAQKRIGVLSHCEDSSSTAKAIPRQLLDSCLWAFGAWHRRYCDPRGPGRPFWLAAPSAKWHLSLPCA